MDHSRMFLKLRLTYHFCGILMLLHSITETLAGEGLKGSFAMRPSPTLDLISCGWPWGPCSSTALPSYWKFLSWHPVSYRGLSLHCLALPWAVWLHHLCKCPSKNDGHLHLIPISQRAEPVPQVSKGHVAPVSGSAQLDTASNIHGLQIFLVSKEAKRGMRMDDTTGKVFLRIN